MRIKNFLGLFVDKFQKNNTTTLAASLAFYTALSLAPILILFVTIAAQLDPHIQSSFLIQARDLIGDEGANTIQAIIENAKLRPDLSTFSGILSVIMLMLSAGIIFGELRSAMNDIFEEAPVPPEEAPVWRKILFFLRARIFQIGLAFGFIFLLIVSLVVSTLISATFQFQDNAVFLSVMNIVVSWSLYSLLFTMMFRFIPNQRTAWRQAFEGGILTGTLFIIGKELIGVYLGNSAVGSAYGAAGSVVVILVWVYYSTLITFIGAHVSFILNTQRKKEAAA